jgi:hypothetical protein
MDTNFGGFAIFVIFATVTGVIGFLALQQGKIKRDIEESRRKREREDLIAMSGIDPTSANPPTVTPTDITPGPHPPHTPGPDGSHGHAPGHSHGSGSAPSSDSPGTWSGGGGFDSGSGGGTDSGGGHHG